MTNAEKFSEVFGFEPNEECPFPSRVCLEHESCNGCPLDGWWEKEYKPCFRLREDL